MEWKTVFSGHLSEIYDVGRVMNQKPDSSGQVRAINFILNQDTPLLPSKLYYSFQKYQMCLSGQPSAIYAILTLAAPLTSLKPLWLILELSEIILSFISVKTFVILPTITSFFLIYSLLSYLLLITLIYSILRSSLSNLSYIGLFKFWVPFTY